MKRFIKFAILLISIALLTACNNVSKPTYNGNLNDSSIIYDDESSSLLSNDNTSNITSTETSDIQSSTGSLKEDTLSQPISSDESIQQGSEDKVSSDSVSLEQSSDIATNESNSSVAVDHTHQFSGATCTEPKKCLICGLTEGEPKHRWKAASCMAPKTCISCGKQEGNLGKHIYIDGYCNICYIRDPNFEYVVLNSTDWEAHVVNDSILYRVVIDFKSSEIPTISYTVFEKLSQSASCDPQLLYNYQGESYIKKSDSDKSVLTVEEIGETVKLSDGKDGALILKRISEENMAISEKVVKFIGYEEFLVKDILFCPIVTK